jgi:hypothetical protein
MRKAFLVSLSIFLLSFSLAFSQRASADQHVEESKVINFEFSGTSYFLRWSKAGQFEFTPASQEDLNSWNEMVTVWLYPSITDGEGLAAQANTVLSNYKNSKGKILRTNSIPRTPEKPAEHFVAAMLGGANGGTRFLEFVAARFVLVDGKGVGIIYSHRSYGEQAPQELGGWVAQNGATVEKAAMGFDSSNVVSYLQKKK